MDGTADQRITIRGAGGSANRDNVVVRGAGEINIFEINHDYYTIEVCVLLLRGQFIGAHSPLSTNIRVTVLGFVFRKCWSGSMGLGISIDIRARHEIVQFRGPSRKHSVWTITYLYANSPCGLMKASMYPVIHMVVNAVGAAYKPVAPIIVSISCFRFCSTPSVGFHHQRGKFEP